MRAILAATLLALCVVSVATQADARRLHRGHETQKVRLQLVTVLRENEKLRGQLNRIDEKLDKLTSMWGKQPQVTNGPGQAAYVPDFGAIFATLETGAAGAGFPDVPAIIPKPLVPLESDIEEARRYLIDTARPGGTMSRLGRDKAIGFLHPDFAVRLAAAIEEAHTSGLPDAGAYSAYRPPGFGVGGFRDKYRSLHAYGLAVDMKGIGSACSGQVRLWHKIAKSHGVTGPYGPCNRHEYNHMQATSLKVAPRGLRKTITARGPIDIEQMWAAASSIVAPIASVMASLTTVPVVERTRIKRHYARRHRAHRHHRRHA